VAAQTVLPEWLQSLALIDGEWLPAQDNSTFDVVNPLNNELIATVANCGAAETQAAIAAASRALADWTARSAKEKSQLLRRWYELVMAHQQALALLLTQEQGKPLAEACR
jgi:succinate-semialdehyde dehydrogenase/glutarate-semialdehyde dehydrogenase